MIVKRRATRRKNIFTQRSLHRVYNCPCYKQRKKQYTFSKQWQEYLLCDLDKRINACCSVECEIKYKKNSKKSWIQHLRRVVNVKCLLCVKRYPFILCMGYCFNQESHRLRTFRNYPINGTPAITLAADGFVYIGKNGSRLVICYLCNTVLQDTGWSDDIHAAHSQRSPNCPMVTLANNDNVAFQNPLSDFKELFSKINSINSRLRESCEACPKKPRGAEVRINDNHNQENPIISAKALEITLTKYGYKVFKDSNILADQPSQQRQLKVCKMLPKFPNYAGNAKRLESFELSPPEFQLLKEPFSKAGFFYQASKSCDVVTPHGRDKVVCFCCGLRMSRERKENIWKEHVRRAPHCHYLLLRHEREIVESSLENHNKVINDEAVQTLLGEGYPSDKVLNAAVTLQRDGRKLSADTLLQQVTGQSLEMSDERTKQENIQLRSILECKLCQQMQVEVAYLDCGHLIACVDCAIVQKVRRKRCNECYAQITGLVRASFRHSKEQSHENSS